MKKKWFVVLGVLAVSLVLSAGCCGATQSASGAESEPDPYSLNYGKTAVAENMHITLENIDGGNIDEDGLRDYSVQFTVRNDGKEKDSVPGAFYLVDSQNRYFEANYFTCGFLVNPGVQKTDTCKFFDVPATAEIKSIVLWDEITDYQITLFELE